MHANAVAGFYLSNVFTDFFDAPRDFVAKRERQTVDLGNARAIMRVRVTDSGSGNANQNFIRTDLRNWNFRFLKRPSDSRQPDGSHRRPLPPLL